MARPALLGGLRLRAELEERCRTVEGALAVDFASLVSVTWLTVPDVIEVLEAVALREIEDRRAARRESHHRRLTELRPAMPEPEVPYELPEFTERFQGLLECVRLHAELGELDEVMELANLGAAFVMDPEMERNPLLDNLAGELLWAVADGLAVESYYVRALDYFGAASEMLHATRMPLDVRRSMDLLIAERCLRLLEAGLPMEEDLLGRAGAALTRIDPSYDRLPEVAAARFAVARLASDRPVLARLASRPSLSPAVRRAAELLAGLDGVAAWDAEFGPFAAPIYAECHDIGLGRAFAHFSMDVLPGGEAGHRSARIGDVELAEALCDELTAAIHRWSGAAPAAGAAFVRDGLRLPLRRAVPTAAMHVLLPFARRPPDQAPESVRFLFGLGVDRTLPAHVDRMLWFFDTTGAETGGMESEAALACAAILVGHARRLLPPGALTRYVGHLELGDSHEEALSRARRGVPLDPAHEQATS
ncbi:hypothetical protein SAMN05444920_107348 [Nonomuraea solani]|uniref:Uncharacterized protein n=1 Tax=Nonomuraea solani TaxID=1144553 RepID=A0A1H6E2C8_9ACTN|nr:hypothetical protein [Nonomuraea solani]SEG91780.1 hypothetical protein SAMN05444920_107348 [Nonomuraea solani]